MTRDPKPEGKSRIDSLVWGLLVSALLHLAFVIPVVTWAVRPIDGGFEMQWLASLDSLDGIGHGVDRDARFDPEQPMSVEEDDIPEPEPAEEPEEDEPVELDEVIPEDEEPVEPERVEEAEPTEPEPDAPAVATKTQEKQPSPRKQARADLPGLDRQGPNQLPALESYGPGNAIFSALVRTDRIRGTNFEEITRRLLEVLPDYRIALSHTGIDPVGDIDSIFMASAQPQYIEHTFLAVRHRMSEENLRDALDRRFATKIEWTSYQDHPVRDLLPEGSPYADRRQIMIARPGLAVMARPEWLQQLTQSYASGDARRDSSRRSMLDGLASIEEAAAQEGILVLVSAIGGRVSLPGIGRVSFDAARLSVTNIDAPRLTIDLTMSDPAQAQRFSQGCPRLKDRAIAQTPLLARGLARTLLGPLTCEDDGRFVTVVGQYRAEEIARVMDLATAFIPRPPVLNRLPPPPPRTEVPPAHRKTLPPPVEPADTKEDDSQEVIRSEPEELDLPDREPAVDEPNITE